MAYYYFIATVGSKIAVTTDRAGANLPPIRSGGWQFVQTLVLLDVVRGAEPAEILRAIERDGFWIGAN